MTVKQYTSEEHRISKDQVDSDALDVIHRLRTSGYEAYLVGGGVRDLMLGKRPKDYDISTSARPEQIKKLFYKNCLLIGRRFRLAHIRFGRKILEVSTFRAGDPEREELITRDNKWGSAEEDVWRRDFTINGLFYDPEEELVIDYVGGCEDIARRRLTSIGDPVIRFRQDPVRMIRLLKFVARFGFSVEEETMAALQVCQEEIVKSAPARVMEEMFRMLESGASAPFFELMVEHGLMQHLLPGLDSFLQGPHAEEIYLYLRRIDEWIKVQQKPVPKRCILAAALLHPILEREIQALLQREEYSPKLDKIFHLVSEVIHAIFVASFMQLPQRMQAEVHYILSMQFRLTPPGKPRKRPPTKLANHREFTLALEFLKLRSEIDEQYKEAYTTWKKLAPPPEQMERPKSRHRHRGGRRRQHTGGGEG